ncbi:MAG: MmcQ/YjbR family DNA-binding protein [Flavobacteriaceae bacterium]|nr:MAG: MmcQ/YjbR family DNA-binding protein [Flavobacteriaceae bacterium]
MNIEQLHNYCIHKKGVTEEFPFDDDTLVFKVMGKMFALASLKKWERGEGAVNLKCDPDKSLELRASYESINAGFHMSQKHWNTVTVNRDVSDAFLEELIDYSYDLVVKGLTKKMKETLQKMKPLQH